jgi:CheY-like chemotaxis protein
MNHSTRSGIPEGRDDPADMPSIEVIELSPEESVQAWAEAKRASRALEENGFYSPDVALHRLSGSFGQVAIRVLVVEDDDVTAHLLSTLLKQHGFLVKRVAYAETALEELRRRPSPDLVLLDVMLPVKDGFDVLKEIRHDAALRDLPVIMVTSRIDDEHVLRGLREGADGYIFKPFKWESLHGCIKSVCGLDATTPD